MSIKDYFIHHLDTEEEAEDCAEWAFGPDFKTLYDLQFPKSWNKNHPDLPQLDGKGTLRKDIEFIVNQWMDYQIKRAYPND